MWSVEPAHAVFAQYKFFAVCECTGSAIRKILNRDHGRDCTAQRHGCRSYGKPLVESPALVRLHMGKGYVTKPFGRQYARNCFTYKGKHLSKAGMEQHWFIVHHEVLIEREPVSAFEHNWCIDAIYPVRDFMNVRP